MSIRQTVAIYIDRKLTCSSRDEDHKNNHDACMCPIVYILLLYYNPRYYDM